MAKSTYYFEINRVDVVKSRNERLMSEIQEIFNYNKGRYGVRRVHKELVNRGYNVNHKRVQRLMHWHTHFYENKIGANLKCRIVNFLNRENGKFKIEFTRNKAKVDEGFVHYNIKLQRLEVTILPRVLLLCIASIFNIEELEKSIFSADQKTLKEYMCW